MWSLTANVGRLRRHGHQGLEGAEAAPPSRCTARCTARCRRCRACRCSRGSIRRCPTPGPVRRRAGARRATPRPSRCCRRSGQVVGAGWQSGKFLYVDTDLKIDLPEARVVIDREQVADLGLDLASVGQELGTLLGGGYVNRFNYLRPQLQGHPADRRGRTGPRSGRCSISRSRRRAAQLVPVSTFTRIEIEHRAARR